MPLKKSLEDIKSALKKFGLDKSSLDDRSTKELVDLYNKCVVPKPQRVPRHNREGTRLRETLKRVYPETETASNISSSQSPESEDGATTAKIARLSLDNISSETNSNSPKSSKEPNSPTKRKVISFSDTSSKPEPAVKKKIVKITFS